MKKQILTKKEILNNPNLLLNKFDISSLKFYKQIFYCYEVVDKTIKCFMYFQAKGSEKVEIYFENYNFDCEKDIKIYFEKIEDITII